MADVMEIVIWCKPSLDLLDMNPEIAADQIAAYRCRLSAADFEWAQQWKWHVIPNRQKTAFYASRMTRRRGDRKQIRVYLHKEVLKRSGLKPRTRHHKIGDHKDGDTLNNTRNNLRWATGSMNSRNTKARRARRAGI